MVLCGVFLASCGVIWRNVALCDDLSCYVAICGVFDVMWRYLALCGVRSSYAALSGVMWRDVALFRVK